jgi:excisionase family DNA binding protein
MGDTGVRRLTIKQAAERIGKRPRTVYDLVDKGRLTGFKHEGRLYTTDVACDEYLSWHPAASDEEAAATVRALALGQGTQRAEAESREAEELRAQLRELEARVTALPPSAALLVLHQCLRHVGKAAALLAALAAHFLWTQQVADSAVRVVVALPT